MTLTIHHLEKSQSERVLLTCEELGLEYTLVKHDRDPVKGVGQADLKAVHPAGTAPVMIDEPAPGHGGGGGGGGRRVVLAESSAIVDYINHVHGHGRLALAPSDKDFAEYLNWFHYVNGTLQATMSRMMMMTKAGVADDSPFMQMLTKKANTGFQMIEDRLKVTGAYLVNDQLTAADTMMMFTLTTMRGFCPWDLSPYPQLLAYLERVAARPAYKRAMKKGDPDLTPMLAANVEPFKFGFGK